MVKVIIINEDQLKKVVSQYVDEVTTTPKPTFGSGMEHVLYSSEHNPNVLYKIGKLENVKRWVKVFQSNPKLFPKIYKIGKLNNDNDYDVYVEIEKLNTKKVLNDWNKLKQLMQLLDIIDNSNDIDTIMIRVMYSPETHTKVRETLRTYNPSAESFYLKWFVFLKETYEYVKANGYLSLDIHRYNYGYDSNGNIKCLDI